MLASAEKPSLLCCTQMYCTFCVQYFYAACGLDQKAIRFMSLFIFPLSSYTVPYVPNIWYFARVTFYAKPSSRGFFSAFQNAHGLGTEQGRDSCRSRQQRRPWGSVWSCLECYSLLLDLYVCYFFSGGGGTDVLGMYFRFVVFSLLWGGGVN